MKCKFSFAPRRISVRQNWFAIEFWISQSNASKLKTKLDYHHKLFHRFAAGILLRRCKSSLGQYLYKLHHKLPQVLRNYRDWEPMTDIHRYLDIEIYTVRKVSKKNVKYFFRGDWDRY